MPSSKPAIPSSSGAAKPVPAPKKNTVDYIASKLSYDTAIPVSIFDDRSEFIERCKPFDIIDGPNPLDDIPEEEEHPHPTAVHSASADVGKSEQSSIHSARKRSRSPLKNALKVSPVKNENDTDGSAATASAAGSLPTFTRPSRSDWAAEQLREGRPYQLLRSRDMETRVRYVLDDSDYEWCAAQHLQPEVVQRGITYLEWAYVTSLLTAATPHVDEAVTAERPSPTATHGGDGTSSPLYENGAVSAFSSNGVRGESASTVVSSPTTRTIARLSRTRRQNEREKQAAMSASAFTCALCSKNVHVLSQEGGAEEGMRNGGTAGASKRSRGTTTTATATTGGGQSHGTGRARGGAGATAPGGASSNHSGSFPSHDVQHQGLRCCECGVVAHLRCWFLTEPPRVPEAWTCDGCTNYAQHRKRSAGVCCMCGRMGGVLLPYVSSAAALRDDGDGDPQSPTQSHPHSSGSSDFAGSPVAQSDMVCHAVCALTMPELAIQQKGTVLRRNGLVDMAERPYVYALRRVGKQKFAMHCVFCEHGGTGRCVQCHHPHCFEAMHASCAAEAHTVDCHTDVAASPSNRHPGGVENGDGGGGGPFSPGGVVVGGYGTDNNGSSATAAAFWSGCSTYCRKHYGYSVSNSIGSASLGDRAEAEAVAMDLTGLLTGGDGVTSPVVKKRGRGRPPVALVQQREAERVLIQQLHAYWLERREQRRCVSGQLVGEINARLRPVVEATLRPEIVKVSADKVRLSHFLSLVPEWQWQLVAIVEGELPLPDEEYDDVQKYRKVAHTRRSGNTRSLYDRMSVAATQLDLMCLITTAMKQECRLRRTNAELEVESLRKLCEWK